MIIMKVCIMTIYLLRIDLWHKTICISRSKIIIIYRASYYHTPFTMNENTTKQTLTELQRSKRVAFKFLQKFEFGHGQVHRIMMKVIPSPTGNTISIKKRFLFCQNFWSKLMKKKSIMWIDKNLRTNKNTILNFCGGNIFFQRKRCGMQKVFSQLNNFFCVCISDHLSKHPPQTHLCLPDFDWKMRIVFLLSEYKLRRVKMGQLHYSQIPKLKKCLKDKCGRYWMVFSWWYISSGI